MFLDFIFLFPLKFDKHALFFSSVLPNKSFFLLLVNVIRGGRVWDLALFYKARFFFSVVMAVCDASKTDCLISFNDSFFLLSFVST